MTANTDMGELHRWGYKGIPIDYEKALYYYNLDTTPNPSKVNAIGEMEVEGQGMERDVPGGIMKIKLAAMVSNNYTHAASTLCRVYSNPKYQFIRMKLAYYWCTLEFMEEDSPRMKALKYENMKKVGVSLGVADKKLIEAKLKECERRMFAVCDAPFADE